MERVFEEEVGDFGTLRNREDLGEGLKEDGCHLKEGHHYIEKG